MERWINEWIKDNIKEPGIIISNIKIKPPGKYIEVIKKRSSFYYHLVE